MDLEARIGSNSKWGFINPDGSWAIEPQFDGVCPYGGNYFHYGYASVDIYGIHFSIDRDGLVYRKGQTPAEFLENKSQLREEIKGWIKSVRKAEEIVDNTGGIAIPLHRMYDRFLHDTSHSEYGLVIMSNGKDFKAFLKWEHYYRFHYKALTDIYYCRPEEIVLSRLVWEKYNCLPEREHVWKYTWPWRTGIDEAICDVINKTSINKYPAWNVDLIYNGEVIHSFTL